MQLNTAIVSSKKSSIRKITSIDEVILHRQKRAEIKRVADKNKPTQSESQTLTEEFFEGLNIG